jgi:hypothetical protein
VLLQLVAMRNYPPLDFRRPLHWLLMLTL